MFEHVIVPFDGTVPGRAVLAPGGDLAWRCGAKMVIVTNSEVSDETYRAGLKELAMAKSGSGVDVWVDADESLASAAVQAATYRSMPLVCVSARGKPGALRKLRALPGTAEQVVAEAPCPVVVIGPSADLSRGLPMTEVVVALDGSPVAEEILPLVARFARELKLQVILVGVVSAGADGSHHGERDYLERQVATLASTGTEVRAELLEAADPATGLLGYLGEHDDALVALTTYGRGGPVRGPLGSVTAKVVANSPRAVMLQRPS